MIRFNVATPSVRRFSTHVPHYRRDVCVSEHGASTSYAYYGCRWFGDDGSDFVRSAQRRRHVDAAGLDGISDAVIRLQFTIAHFVLARNQIVESESADGRWETTRSTKTNFTFDD